MSSYLRKSALAALSLANLDFLHLHLKPEGRGIMIPAGLCRSNIVLLYLSVAESYDFTGTGTQWYKQTDIQVHDARADL